MNKPQIHPSSLRQLAGYFLKLGAIGFGGPIALAHYMERDLVEERRWISKIDYVQGLALAELAPGPLAAQLAIYLGYAHSGVIGATAIAIAFVIPSFLMVLAIAILYVHYGGLPWMQALFYGIGAAVVGIIARSAYKLTKKTVGRKKLLWAIYALAALITGFTREEYLWVFLVAGGLTLFAYAPPAWSRRLSSIASPAWLGIFAPAGVGLADTGLMSRIFWFFAKAGACVFGSGLAIVPFLYGGVVKNYHWLTEHQFLDAVAVAMITPGPVVITVGFIGYLVAGVAGATLAALGVFLPVYLFVIIPAPWYRRHGSNPQLIAIVEGVTAAAIGALAGAVYVIAGGAIKDIPTALIALGSLLALIYTKLPEPALVCIAGVLGLALFRG